MTVNESNLKDTIDKLIEEKTFSLDALEAIKNLRDKVIKHEAKAKNTEDRIVSLQDNLDAANKKLKESSEENLKFKSKQTEIEEREKKIFDLEKNAAVSLAQSVVYDRVFQTIFRNTVHRESTLKSVVMPPTYQGGPSYMNNTPETITKESDPSGT